MHRTYNQIIDEFVELCHMFSDSVDMIQAGGGNASTKYIDSGKPVMLIKASGYLMSEVGKNTGFTAIDTLKVNQLLKEIRQGKIAIDAEHLINQRISNANLSTLRPSIETFLHAMLPVQHVLHVHDLATLLYASTKAFESDLMNQWNGVDGLEGLLLIPYKKPGVHLALSMMNGLDKYSAKYGEIPKGIILQNHGLIIPHQNYDEIYNSVVDIIEQIKKKAGLPITFGTPYRNGYHIKCAANRVFSGKTLFVRLCEDKDLVDYKFMTPSFPDALVFCGPQPLIIDSVDEASLIRQMERYKEHFNEFPKMVIYETALYFLGESVKKCLEIQDVLKIQHILSSQLGDDLKTLSEEEALSILNWEAEKYRKNL